MDRKIKIMLGVLVVVVVITVGAWKFSSSHRSQFPPQEAMTRTDFPRPPLLSIDNVDCDRDYVWVRNRANKKAKNVTVYINDTKCGEKDIPKYSVERFGCSVSPEGTVKAAWGELHKKVQAKTTCV